MACVCQLQVVAIKVNMTRGSVLPRSVDTVLTLSPFPSLGWELALCQEQYLNLTLATLGTIQPWALKYSGSNTQP